MISLMDISDYMPYDMEYYMMSLYAICMFMCTVLFAEFAYFCMYVFGICNIVIDIIQNSCISVVWFNPENVFQD